MSKRRRTDLSPQRNGSLRDDRRLNRDEDFSRERDNFTHRNDHFDRRSDDRRMRDDDASHNRQQADRVERFASTSERRGDEPSYNDDRRTNRAFNSQTPRMQRNKGQGVRDDMQDHQARTYSNDRQSSQRRNDDRWTSRSDHDRQRQGRSIGNGTHATEQDRQASLNSFRRPLGRSIGGYSSGEDERVARRRDSDRRDQATRRRIGSRETSLDRDFEDNKARNDGWQVTGNRHRDNKTRPQPDRQRQLDRSLTPTRDRRDAEKVTDDRHGRENLRRNVPARIGDFDRRSESLDDDHRRNGSRTPLKNDERARRTSITSNTSGRAMNRNRLNQSTRKDDRSNDNTPFRRRRSISPLPKRLRAPVSRNSPPPPGRSVARSPLHTRTQATSPARDSAARYDDRKRDNDREGFQRSRRSSPPRSSDLQTSRRSSPSRFRGRVDDRDSTIRADRRSRFDDKHKRAQSQSKNEDQRNDDPRARTRDEPDVSTIQDTSGVPANTNVASRKETSAPGSPDGPTRQPSMSPELADLLQSPTAPTQSAQKIKSSSTRSNQSSAKRLQAHELRSSPTKRSKIEYAQEQFRTPESIKTPYISKARSSTGKRPSDSSNALPAQSTTDVVDRASSATSDEAIVYTRMGQVGEGTYGKVYKARHRKTNEFVALKRIRMEQERDGFPITSMREIKLLQRLKHPGVVRLLEMLVERGAIYMVFEYMDHDLTGILSNTNITFEPPHIKDLAHQLFNGLAYLHHRGVLHRDIKGSNILLNNAGELKLADFGLARFYRKKHVNANYTNRVITLWFKPPELLLGATAYDAGVDVWSAGCIFVELFTRATIFPGRDELHQIEMIYQLLGTPTPETWPDVSSLPWYELIQFKPQEPTFQKTFGSKLSPAAMELSLSILQLNPALRPLAADVLEHPYFTTEEPKAVRRTLFDIAESHEWDSKQRRRDERAKKQKEDNQRASAATNVTAPAAVTAPIAVNVQE